MGTRGVARNGHDENPMKIVGAVAIGVSALVLVQQGVAEVSGLFRAGTMKVQVTAADLLESCGYGRFEVELRRGPSAGCGDLIRESVRAAGTRGIIAVLVDGHSRGRVCVGGLLELSDTELAATYAQWAKREQYAVRRTLPAEMLINLALMDEYLCRSGNRRRG